ncbi:MAG TPA: Dabb family protein [Planctomicrobium sp.]|nr:Dabb family protein [Planctomicrobium sp.]
MKTMTLFCLGLTLLIVSGILVNASRAEKTPAGLLRHVVLFTFKPEATPAQIQELIIAFGKLPSQISQIKDFEWGTDNSPEGLQKEHTHCFLVTFASEEDRDAYLPHPAHQAFVDKLKPLLADVTVVDYWAKK